MSDSDNSFIDNKPDITEGISSPEQTNALKTKKPEPGSIEWTNQRKENHKKVERKRREAINLAMVNLGRVIPGDEKNKSKILSKAVEHILDLNNEIASLKRLVAVYRTEYGIISEDQIEKVEKVVEKEDKEDKEEEDEDEDEGEEEKEEEKENIVKVETTEFNKDMEEEPVEYTTYYSGNKFKNSHPPSQVSKNKNGKELPTRNQKSKFKRMVIQDGPKKRVKKLKQEKS